MQPVQSVQPVAAGTVTGGAGALPWPGGLRSLDPVTHPKAICTDGSRANFMPQEGRHRLAVSYCCAVPVYFSVSGFYFI